MINPTEMPFLSRLQPNRQAGGSKTADDQQFEATLRKTAHEFASINCFSKHS